MDINRSFQINNKHEKTVFIIMIIEEMLIKTKYGFDLSHY